MQNADMTRELTGIEMDAISGGAAMSPKSVMLSVIVSVWMLAAVSAGALPFVHAIPWLKAAGNFMPLLAALAIGVAVSVPLSLAARRLCDLGKPQKISWRFSRQEAVLFGIIGWGLPVGLLFAENEFLASSNFFVLISAITVWPLAGMAFGLLARWSAQRRDRDSQAA
jgi:hypothetical protein